MSYLHHGKCTRDSQLHPHINWLTNYNIPSSWKWLIPEEHRVDIMIMAFSLVSPKKSQELWYRMGITVNCKLYLLWGQEYTVDPLHYCCYMCDWVISCFGHDEQITTLVSTKEIRNQFFIQYLIPFQKKVAQQLSS